jgi:cell division GTPase FtsZ
MNILLLSTGGGGGNILRSLKNLFRRDLIVTQKTDPRYAERVRRAIATRFLDTNEFSLSDVPIEERLLIGAATTRRVGSRHCPDVARQALEESRSEIEDLLSKYSVTIIIGTGGKGTGAGTIFPLAQMARQQKKLVIPIFVRPSFERHEVEKRRYDHALGVTAQFDAAEIRLMEILNDRGYLDTDPQPQSVVWERMNLPIARGLRGLLYVLWDLSQVDPSDLSSLFAGPGRLRIGFSEIDPPTGQAPSDNQVEDAVRGCWENSFYAFNGPVGTSLVCIQGNWSNVVDAKIKGRLAAFAVGNVSDNSYNPLYARGLHTPKPWGVTTVFAEYTGNHSPLEIAWIVEKRPAALVSAEPRAVANRRTADKARPQTVVEPRVAGLTREQQPEEKKQVFTPTFSTFWEFAVALNRSDPAALELASNGIHSEMAIDGVELRKLLGTVWFRSVFPRLSQGWRDRILQVLAESVAVPNHMVRVGRQGVHVSDLTYEQLKEILAKTSIPDAVRPDLQLLLTVGNLWGAEALGRLRFTDISPSQEPSKLAFLLQGFRH